MGAYIRQKDNSTVKNVFWLYFAIALVVGIISLFAAGTTTYSDEQKNKVKNWGVGLGLLGFIAEIGVVLFLCAIVRKDNLLFWVLGVIGVIYAVAYIILMIHYRDKIKSLTLTETEKQIQDVLEDVLTEEYQLRYNFEYVILRNLIMNNDKEFMEKLKNQQDLTEYLTNYYNKVPNTTISDDDFKIFKKKTRKYTAYVFRLPKTTTIPLVNIIGVVNAKDKNRFFAFSDSLAEWHDEHARSYLLFDTNDEQSMLDFICRMEDSRQDYLNKK